MTHKTITRFNRQLKAELRDSWILLQQFHWQLAIFMILILGSSIAYDLLAIYAGTPLNSLAEAVYTILTLTFLQPFGNFPDQWYLQVFYFIMPIVGIGIVASGLADFGTMFFSRRARGKEWEMAVASTFSDHIVLVGLGHLGFRVALSLHDLAQDVVVIEIAPNPDLKGKIQKLGIPIIEDDGTREVILEAANIRKAQAIILCTQNDSLNLHMAVKARNLNPSIRVVIRIFDEDFATSLQDQFGFIALSATEWAAPVFAASSAGLDITPPISIMEQPNSLARLEITPGSRLIGKTINKIEDTFHVSIVFFGHAGESQYHPTGEILLAAHDLIAVLGSPAHISELLPEHHHPRLKK